MPTPSLGYASLQVKIMQTLLLCCLVVACQATQDTTRPATLLVPSDATDVKWTDEFAGAVVYTVERDYPARAFLDEIGKRLSSNGFLSVAQDLFNPDQQNSHRVGWLDYIDGDNTVFTWIGDWKNERGDQVRYELRYQIPKGAGSAGRRLRVSATHIDVTSVMRLQQRRPPQ
jgi:hypothetical protein